MKKDHLSFQEEPALMKSIRKWLGRLFFSKQVRRSLIMKKLQNQRFLLHSGLEATADVLNVERKGVTVHNLQEVNLFLGVHFPGHLKVEFICTTSVVEQTQLPKSGDKLNVKFNPMDTSAILIL